MLKLKIIGLAVSTGAVFAADAAAAGPVEATRYKTSDGVEVIVGRDAANASAAVSPAKRQPPPQAGITSAPTASPSGVSYKVPVQDQAERDRDRLTILTAELMTEGRALEQKRHALKSPRASMDLGSEQLQALRESVERHEGNIRALNAEIRRVNVAFRQEPSSGSAIRAPVMP